jgi:biotin synthase
MCAAAGLSAWVKPAPIVWALSIRLATLPSILQSVPINALVPVKGTVLGDMLADTPLARIDDIEFVRTVAVARHHHADASMVRLSAGRESMSEMTQAMCFMAGANSIFTGDTLLTAPNAGDDADAAMLARLGLKPMAIAMTEAQVALQNGCPGVAASWRLPRDRGCAHAAGCRWW